MSDTQWNLWIYGILSNPADEQVAERVIRELHDNLATEQCRIAIQFHAKQATRRYWITQKSMTQESLPSEDSSNPASLTRFLDAAHHWSSARATALVLYAHGSGLDELRRRARERDRSTIRLEGWPEDFPIEHPDTDWLGPDPNTQRFLTNVSTLAALAASLKRRVDLLGFNACLMGLLEVVHETRSAAAVQVVSQGFAHTWPYAAIIQALSNDPMQSAEQLATTIVDRVNAADNQAAPLTTEMTSAFRSAGIAEISAALEPYAQRVRDLITSRWPSVLDAVTHVQRITSAYNADLASVVDTLGAGDPAAEVAAAEVKRRIEAARIARSDGAISAGASGLSVFLPLDKTLDLDAAYRGLDFAAHGWARFLGELQKSLPDWQMLSSAIKAS